MRCWPEARRKRARWLSALAIAACAPKCALCLAAYAGVGAAWLGAPELCGVPARTPHAWAAGFALVGAGVAATLMLRRSLRGRQP